MPEAEVESPYVLALEGGHNFREVGGYPAASGLRLRRRLIWRSAGLDRLTESDCRLVEVLGIRTIADLRSDHERKLFPTVTGVSDGARTLSWRQETSAISPPAKLGHASHAMDSTAIRAEIVELYTHIAEAHAVQFRDVYMAIAEGRVPILVHCTAGKDRTGLAIAILLELIGIEREWVVWDYEQTNRHLKAQMVHLESAAGVGRMAEWLGSLGPEGRDIVLRADPSYLLAALSGIEEKFGSVARYAFDLLGISTDTQVRLREQLLER